MALTASIVAAAALGLITVYFVRRLVTTPSLPLPPGPPALPVIGNVHQVPKTFAWRQFAEWRKQYGSIYHLNVFGQHVIVLTTSQAAHDLLAKRGATFSDRPKMFVAQELALKNMNVLLMDYDERFKVRQRLEATVLGQNASSKYLEFQSIESKQLMYDLLMNAGGKGTNIHGFLERTTASTIFALFYGFRIKDSEAPELVNAMQLDDEFSEFVQLGAFLVDTFPALNILPGPLAPWKAKAEAHHQRQRKLHIGNLNRGLKAPGWTFTKQLHQTVQEENLPISFDELAFEFGTLVDASLDGTVETLNWFIISIITQDNGFVAKAKQELDRVVGRNRLPTLDDMPHLPYISALLEEVLRWRAVGAGGVPHFTKVESEYQGYRIPANSVVVANHWAVTREEAVFGPDTDSFVPERWMDGDKLKILPVAGFGYGRRTCPGRFFARNMIWVSMARLLWAFDITAGRLEDGELTVVDADGCTDGLVMRALPYKASFEPRDENAREVIMKDGDTYGEDLPAILSKIGEQLNKKK
ncbi:unnamed protein product [Clonostachys rosea f. rosea IK726]|uniref:Cytochrome P450 n=2 Tax=Bionectria ochroleuca TaxID=29856 RepID=A0A0B7K4X5_BIOOC|nr:unnamed protein product [Clonostachys rosea f. rosea IK726]